ncbi:circadian clock KaiB family protein [Methylopila sp. M107]|uniref:circadian clock KaiB family protein n=1 Tax=Methylopila sp. M107 TaxID=1101190 RepID=UPI00037B7856|nr:circadian clock KaiB family protein [Methylopila sp. M107]
MTAAPEPADRNGSGAKRYVLRLFVTGATPRSIRAIENLREICETRLAGRYELEVVDIYQHPEAASANQVVAAPTLLKLLPFPIRRIVGDLADHARVLQGLELAPETGDDNLFASFGGPSEDGRR